MKANFRPVCLGLILAVATSIASAQDTSHVGPRLLGADPKNGSISGRVNLPSGHTADFNIKITFSNAQSMLTTFFTDKHGEFRFENLEAGTYYITAEGDQAHFEPVTEMVRLSRSQVTHVNLTLRKKEETGTRRPQSQVVSTVELSQQIPEAARKAYEQGVKQVGKGKLLQAIAHFQQALSLYPEYLVARNDLGAQYLKLKRLEEAAETFRTALTQNPRYFNARFNLGLVHFEQQEYGEAISHLNQAIAIDSTRPAAHLWLGVTLLHSGDLPAAERVLSKALITGSPGFAVTHFYLAQVYLKRGDQAEAARALRAYLAEEPKGEYAGEARLLLKSLPAKPSSPSQPD